MYACIQAIARKSLFLCNLLACMHACTLASVQKKYMDIHTYMYTCTYHTQTIHTHIHTYMYTHTNVQQVVGPIRKHLQEVTPSIFSFLLYLWSAAQVKKSVF